MQKLVRSPRSLTRNQAIGLCLTVLWLAVLGCSSLDDVVGQRRGAPTPTVPLFATATPGGRVSVWLITPTGQAADSQQPTATLFGQVVGPAATATAAFATLQAATATALATVSGPIYQPGDCPKSGGPPPPPKPAAFNQYPVKIGQYLSAGGPPTILEAMLRGWGALEEGAQVQANTDLTGDGIPEVLVNIYDPTYYKPGQPAPGQLLVFGCFQKGYRLLFSTDYSIQTMLPQLNRVGEMNNNGVAVLAYTQQTCNDQGQCAQDMQIMSWDSTIGVFRPLNDTPMNATNGKVSIADLDKDGILEVAISFTPVDDPAAGPQRKTTNIWDWDGVNYRLALIQADPPVFRIHAVHDADVHFNQGDWKGAIKLFDRVRDDSTLQNWTVPNETETLRAYATYKKMLAYIAQASSRNANDVLNTLQTENPAGSPGEAYATLAQNFMDTYKQTRDRKKTCAAMITNIAGRPDLLTVLNGFGAANRTYTPVDLCPFADK